MIAEILKALPELIKLINDYPKATLIILGVFVVILPFINLCLIVYSTFYRKEQKNCCESLLSVLSENHDDTTLLFQDQNELINNNNEAFNLICNSIDKIELLLERAIPEIKVQSEGNHKIRELLSEIRGILSTLKRS